MLLSEIDFTQPKSLEDLKRLVIKRREAYYQELVFSHAERLESISPSFRMKEEEARRYEKQMSHPSVKPCIRNERSEEEKIIFLQLWATAAFMMFKVPVMLFTEYFSGATIDSPAALNAAR